MAEDLLTGVDSRAGEAESFSQRQMGSDCKPRGYTRTPTALRETERVQLRRQGRETPGKTRETRNAEGVLPRRCLLTGVSESLAAKSVSSPSRTRTYNKPVNSRLLYH